MANLEKNSTTRDIDLNIQAMWEVIDNYLPNKYTPLVQEKLSNKSIPASSTSIRHTKSVRKGNIAIIKAMYDVAVETKNLLNQ